MSKASADPERAKEDAADNDECVQLILLDFIFSFSAAYP
jgi:hypothetical protein